MAIPDRLYVDANVFVRLFEGNDKLSAALARLFLREPTGQRPLLATSELTFAELVVVPIREGNEQLVQRYDNWTRSNEYLEIGPVDRAILWSAAALRARYSSLKLPDAIHVGTALKAGCSHFMTADLKLAGSYVLDVQHRGDAPGSAGIEVMRPDIDIIDAIVAGE
jgi:predicted nucleic acid-binding protein